MGKNLANCTPKEFMVQTRLIKHAVEKWLTDTDIMKIRERLPQIPDDATDEDKKKLLSMQAKKNASAIFDAIFDDHPDETVNLLALLCFVPVIEADNYPMTEYMKSITEMLGNEDLWAFFTSLAVSARRLGITTG